MKRTDIETRLAEALRTRPEQLVAAYLFGSVACDEHRATSDIDVAILYAEPAPSGFAGLLLTLEGDLERALERTVQVVALQGAPVDLVHRVLRDGRLVLERDRSRRIRFEVRARNDYFDLLPHLQRYRRTPVGRQGASR